MTTKTYESEILKHLVFACVASTDGKRRQAGKKVRDFDRYVIDAYKKPFLSATKYNRKIQELNIVMKMIDQMRDPKIASYNVERGRDYNNVGCYELIFEVNYNNERLIFKFHTPVTTKRLKIGNNNYPYITSIQRNNNASIDAALNFKNEDIFSSGLGELELYA